MKNSIKSYALLASLASLAVSCGPEWGQMDPPAGNQIYPTLQNVGCYTFDEEGDLDPEIVQFVSYANEAMPEIVTDKTAKSPVLKVGKESYVKLDNMLTNVVCQNGAGVTFWLYEEGEAPADASILHWENEDGSQKLDFKANGKLEFANTRAEGEDEEEPADENMGKIMPDGWHFCALQLRNDGYALYVDGNENMDVAVADTDLSEAVQLMAQAPDVYVNYGSAQHADIMVDDITFFRNQITAREVKMPRKGNIGSSESGPDYSKWLMVGEEDNTTGFWTAWGPYVNLTGDGTIHYSFINYTDGINNWDNWLLCLTNGVERGGDGYTEYIVLRADNWGWATLYDTGTIESDYNWDTFKEDMNGAKVEMDINRNGANVEIICEITTEDGEKTYHYKKTIEGVASETLGSFLLVERGHLLIDPESVFTGQTFAPGAYTVGTDLNTGFWSVWSNQVRMTGDFKNFCFEFINHSPGEGSQNWQNWGLVVTNGYQSAPDGQRDPEYSEYYYLRADAWGWGGAFDRSKMTHSFDWDTYKADMKDANVKMYFTLSNGELTMSARQTRTDGSRMPEYRFVTPEVGVPVSLILTCEGSWLEILKVGYYPFADMSPEETND